MRKLNKSELKRVYGGYGRGKDLIDADTGQLSPSGCRRAAHIA